MAIRLQPLEIDIPADDPFKNDLLSRKEPAEILTHLVGSIESPCVLAVDAAWGLGKTTFLKLWAQHLRNNKIPVVEFNAWETDHSGDPFIALSSELMDGLRGHLDKTDQKIEEVKTAAVEVLRHAVPGVIRLVTAGVLDLGPLAEKEISQFLVSHADDRLARHQTAQKSIDKFKNALQDAAGSLSRSRDDKPLVVMIDELDRCRPTYAVEFLEVAKHLFSAPGIIFVLAINRSELAHSIKALYGIGFNAVGYLQRFFDADFRLPEPDRSAFIGELFRSMQIDVHLRRTRDEEAREEAQIVRKLMNGFFGASGISLRDIAQAVHRLGLVFASLRADQRWFFRTTAVALILRTLNSNLYHRFVRGEASDLEVVESIFEHSGRENLQWTHAGRIFESIIIFSFIEQKTKGDTDRFFNSPLLEKYQEVTARGEQNRGQDRVDKSADQPRDSKYEHARDIVSMVDILRRKPYVGPWSGGFSYSVQRLELISKGLMGDASSKTSHA